jgi:hypothetical protein
MLKAYCIYHDITPPRTHDISSILQTLSVKDPDIAEKLEKADELSDYSVDIRYPESHSRLTVEDANEAISILSLLSLRLLLWTTTFEKDASCMLFEELKVELEIEFRQLKAVTAEVNSLLSDTEGRAATPRETYAASALLSDFYGVVENVA